MTPLDPISPLVSGAGVQEECGCDCVHCCWCNQFTGAGIWQGEADAHRVSDSGLEYAGFPPEPHDPCEADW